MLFSTQGICVRGVSSVPSGTLRARKPRCSHPLCLRRAGRERASGRTVRPDRSPVRTLAASQPHSYHQSPRRLLQQPEGQSFQGALLQRRPSLAPSPWRLSLAPLPSLGTATTHVSHERLRAPTSKLGQVASTREPPREGCRQPQRFVRDAQLDDPGAGGQCPRLLVVGGYHLLPIGILEAESDLFDSSAACLLEAFHWYIVLGAFVAPFAHALGKR